MSAFRRQEKEVLTRMQQEREEPVEVTVTEASGGRGGLEKEDIISGSINW